MTCADHIRLFRIVTCVIFLTLSSCSDEPAPEPEGEEQSPDDQKPDEEPDPQEIQTVKLQGVVLEGASGSPIENVQIIGFVDGSITNNLSTFYGSPVVLGVTDKCGKFNVTLPDSIKGIRSHGAIDTTVARIYYYRPDFGTKMTTVKFQSDTVSVPLSFAPTVTPFYRYFYVVLAEDEKTVQINWDIYSGQRNELCYLPVSFMCPEFAGSYMRISRSDIDGERFELPFAAGKQSLNDDDLPDGDFGYRINFSGSSYPLEAEIKRGIHDTVFVISPSVFPVLNGCN